MRRSDGLRLEVLGVDLGDEVRGRRRVDAHVLQGVLDACAEAALGWGGEVRPYRRGRTLRPQSPRCRTHDMRGSTQMSVKSTPGWKRTMAATCRRCVSACS